jgi:hypothetical protein
LADHRGEEPIGDLMVQEALAVLGEGRGVEDPGVDGQAQEPLEQQVVVQPLAERPLAADRVQRHQHRRLQELLGRHAGAPDPRVHGLEVTVEFGEHVVDDLTDPSDRMTRRDQLLGAQRHQHRQLPIRRSSHQQPPQASPPPEECRTRARNASTYKAFFRTLLGVGRNGGACG